MLQPINSSSCQPAGIRKIGTAKCAGVCLFACQTYALFYPACQNCGLCLGSSMAAQLIICSNACQCAAEAAHMQKIVYANYLDADLLPVNALGCILLRLEAFAATAIKAAAGGRIVDAFTEAHFLVTPTSGAGEGHALNEGLDGTDPHNCALDAYNLACSNACGMFQQCT